MFEERLQKYMARCGVASRRKSEEIIRAGRVTVDGQVVTELGVRIDPEQVTVAVDGRPLAVEARVHYAVNKPVGHICSNDPVGDHPKVVSLVDAEERLYPVGRLDVESHGLVIVTNDGDLAYRLTHPSFEVERTYRVVVRGRLKPEEIQRLEQGLELEDGPTLPTRVAAVKAGADRSRCEITLREGRNRQVRRMFDAIGHRVEDLERTRMGPLKLGRLPLGEWRRLSANEVIRLYQQTTSPRPAGEAPRVASARPTTKDDRSKPRSKSRRRPR